MTPMCKPHTMAVSHCYVTMIICTLPSKTARAIQCIVRASMTQLLSTDRNHHGGGHAGKWVSVNSCTDPMVNPPGNTGCSRVEPRVARENTKREFRKT